MSARWGFIGGVVACAALGGCGGGGEPVAAVGDSAAPVQDWRRVATPQDRARLRGWRGAWVDALAQVPVSDVSGDAALFDPDHALTGATPPEGLYRCRVYKLGKRARTGPVFKTAGWVACRIAREGERLVLGKIAGAQRPIGTVYPDTDARSVFLGTMELGDEGSAMDYGRDAARDMAGFIERIGPRRWRLVLPYPRFESTLDVVELEPGR